MLSFFLFRRYFFSSRTGAIIKLVSWTCLAGMAVSVAALIVIVSVMGGFGKAIQSRLLSNSAHLVIHFKDNPFLKNSSTSIQKGKKNNLLSQNKNFSSKAQLQNKNSNLQNKDSSTQNKNSNLQNKDSSTQNKNSNSSSESSVSQNKNSLQKERYSLFFQTEDLPPLFDFLSSIQKEGIKSAFVFETQDLILKSSKGFIGVSARGYSSKQWEQKLIQSSLFESKEEWLDSHHFSETKGAKQTSSEQANLEQAGTQKIVTQETNKEQTEVEKADTHQTNTENSRFDFKNKLTNKPLPLKSEQGKNILLSYELALQEGFFPGEDITLIPLVGLLLPPNLLPPIKKFAVQGVLKEDTKTPSLNLYYQQGSVNFGQFSKIKYGAEIRLHDPQQAPMYQKLFKDHKVETWMDRNSTLFFALKLEKFIMTLFLTLAFLISCLGISSALFLLMTQKTEDLAILQAMGLRPQDIVKVFTRLGLYLSLLGIFIGAFIGFGGTAFLKYNTWNILPEMYEDRTLPAVFLPQSYVLILLGSLALAWLSCYLPTKYFSKIKPAELLKSVTGV